MWAYIQAEVLCGNDAPVVNALSEWMEVCIFRQGGVYRIRFARGEMTQPLMREGDHTGPTGTHVTFKSCPQIFTKTEFDFSMLERRIRELASLNPDLKIVPRDERYLPVQEAVIKY